MEWVVAECNKNSCSILRVLDPINSFSIQLSFTLSSCFPIFLWFPFILITFHFFKQFWVFILTISFLFFFLGNAFAVLKIGNMQHRSFWRRIQKILLFIVSFSMWFSYTFNYLGKHKANEVFTLCIFSFGCPVFVWIPSLLLKCLQACHCYLQVVNVITQHWLLMVLMWWEED